VDLNPCLPGDGAYLGRIWTSGAAPGPSVVSVVDEAIYDLTGYGPTMSALLERPDIAKLAKDVGKLPRLMPLSELLECRAAEKEKPHLLAPCDLQAVKACGVTFMASLIERVIEEHAGGDRRQAASLRGSLSKQIGENLRDVKPGSKRAMSLKRVLIEKRMWSQYLEVAIGPDAEVFTKSQVLSAVGHGSDIGVHPESEWNNPEPEIVLAVNSYGEVRGATLGNDVNLRDVEGRSALLLGKAKDNNASCSVGPFIRLFDTSFNMDDIRSCVVSLKVLGCDGYVLESSSDMRKISRDPQDLVKQVINPHHHYPDGFVLFLGTMFAPTADREQPGEGFTHRRGDIVEISTPQLGRLVNRVEFTDAVPPWSFGISALMNNLVNRGLIKSN
jgi:fumarylacetoacetate (FAA) hydrolase family protein